MSEPKTPFDKEVLDTLLKHHQKFVDQVESIGRDCFIMLRGEREDLEVEAFEILDENILVNLTWLELTDNGNRNFYETITFPLDFLRDSNWRERQAEYAKRIQSDREIYNKNNEEENEHEDFEGTSDMSDLLGEGEVIDSGQTLKALEVASAYGMISGDHHKQWVIDQMVRALLGEEGYEVWLKEMNSDPEYDPWWTGVAP